MMTDKKLFVLVLFGAPGSGKGTVSQYLKDKYDVLHFSTGNLLRNEVKIGSDIGLKIRDILETGSLVGDDVVNAIIEKNLLDIASGGRVVILDGYPRTVLQAQALDRMMSGSVRDAVHVIELDIDRDAVVARISQRRVCAKCGNTYGPKDNISVCVCGGELVKRKDDEELSVRNRLKKYEDETVPVADYYSGRLVKISGNGLPDEVTQRIDEVLCGFGIEKRR